jgi:hypothetical protein
VRQVVEESFILLGAFCKVFKVFGYLVLGFEDFEEDLILVGWVGEY